MAHEHVHVHATSPDLHALLAAAGERGPFLLVGHSIGGTIARLYATTYADHVSGMVLVDASSEFLPDNETLDQWKIQRKLMAVDAASGALPADTPPDFGTIFDAAQAKAQARLAQLEPDAIHITDTNSGHNIHLVQPQLVTDAIRLAADLVAR